MKKYRMLDILDTYTKEPKGSDFYYYYTGELCSLNPPVEKCKGGSLIIHRLTGGLDGTTTIKTTEVQKIVPMNEQETKWCISTLNTDYIIEEYIKD